MDFFRNLLNDFFYDLFDDLVNDFFYNVLNDFLNDFFRNVFFSNRFRDFFNRFLYNVFHDFFNDFFHDFFGIVHNFFNVVQSRRFPATAKRIPSFYHSRRRRTAISRTCSTRKIEVLQTKLTQTSGHFPLFAGQIAPDADLTALASGNFDVVVGLCARLNFSKQFACRVQRIHNGKAPSFTVQIQIHFTASLMAVQTAVTKLTQVGLGLIFSQATRQRFRIAAASRRDIARARSHAQRRFQALFFHKTNIDAQKVKHLRQLVQG